MESGNNEKFDVFVIHEFCLVFLTDKKLAEELLINISLAFVGAYTVCSDICLRNFN